MASKLFHAIVAVGVSLGTACAGKVGGDLVEDKQQDTPKEDASSTADVVPVPDVAAPDVRQEASVDAAIKDAGPDVNWDAYCDAAWPTTKGSPPVPSCVDPNKECKQEEMFPCAVALDEKTCEEDFTKQTASVCVNKTWTCKPGRRAVQDCKCWKGPSGVTCRDGG